MYMDNKSNIKRKVDDSLQKASRNFRFGKVSHECLSTFQ